MPFIRRAPAVHPSSEELTQRLYDELQSPKPIGQPLITQNPVGDTDNYNIYVVWDRWRGTSPEWRPTVIREAFRRYDPSSRDKIPVAMGYTTREAIAEGILPVKIVPFLKGHETGLGDAIRRSMIEEGGVEMPDGRVELRFFTRDDAHDVLGRLADRYPGKIRIVEEEPQADWSE